MKRIVSMTLTFIIAFSIFIPVEIVYAENIEEAGNILKELGVLSGINQKGDLGLNNYFKRQDMVVMISRLFGDEETAKNFNDLSIPITFKDLAGQNERIKFYIPYIRWAIKKGLIKGHDNNTFGFDENVKVQQYQAVLLRALGYNDEADDWKKVPNKAEELHIMDGLSLKPEAYLTRGQMAVMTLNALQQEINRGLLTLAEMLDLVIPEPFKVEATVKVENNTAIFTGQAYGTKYLVLQLKPASTNITMEAQNFGIPLDEDGKFTFKVDNLQVGNYQYRFQSDGKNTEYELFTINVLPFNLVDIKASNLKEITLTFTQPVEKSIASLASNYTTSAGLIKDVRFEENDTKIVILLTTNMTQNMKYKISAHKIKSASGEEITLNNYEFVAYDNDVPKVISVKQLGSKGLRIYLSEPVKTASTTNIKVDEKPINGSTTLEDNIITLTIPSYYALKEGKHTITISNLEDYAGNKMKDETISFTIVKDSTPPSIISASATIEEAIIEFDEEIDPNTALTMNFYWKQGNTKKYSNKVVFKENKAYVEFVNNTLPSSETTIYVENVSDYSGNKLKASEVKVVPTIDTSEPEVVNYIVAEDGKSITVYFNKNVIGIFKNYYSITDKDNKPVNIVEIQGSGKEYKIILADTLPVGLNTLTISGIQDTTPLKKQMEKPFITTIDMADIEKPKIVSHYGLANNIIIYFSKFMDMGTIQDLNNYLMVFDGKTSRLPENTRFIPGNDGKSITIQLPEYYNNIKVQTGPNASLSKLTVFGVRDISGNELDSYIKELTFDSSTSGNARAVDYYSDKPGKQGIITDTNEIKIRFNIPIIYASPSDFVVPGRTVYNVVANGTDEVTLYLDYAQSYYFTPTFVTIIPNNSMKTVINTSVDGGVVNLIDKVPPHIVSYQPYLKVNGNVIEVQFSKKLEKEGDFLYRRDIEVVRLADNKILSKDGDYTTSLKSGDESVLLITILRREINSKYAIRLVGENNSEHLFYIRDIDGNLAIPSGVFYTETEIPKY